MEANSNQQPQPTLDELAKKGTEQRDLKDVMKEYGVDEMVSTDKPAALPVEEVKSVLPPEIENNPDFKALPEEDKARLRAGKSLDPMIAELEGVSGAQEFYDLVNAHRVNNGQELLEPEVVKGGTISKEILNEGIEQDDLQSSITRELEELTASVTSEANPNNDEDDEANIERQLRDFERHLESGTVTYFNEDEHKSSETSAAYPRLVRKNDEYVSNLKDALSDNDIKFKTKRDNGARKALLKGFTQRKSHVTTPLVNSGIYVTLSGANIPEIIQMQSLVEGNRETAASIELRKLGFIVKHLVDSSVGEKLSVSQLSKLVYAKDQETLYFNMVAASFPGENEFPVYCENDKCKHQLILKVGINDMVLNAHEFQDEAHYILYQNQSAQDIIDKSAVSKEKQIILPNGLIISVKNPTIHDVLYLTTLMSKLVSEGAKLDQYTNVLGYLQYINYIGMKSPDGPHYEKFASLADTMEVADLLTACDAEDLAVLDDEIEEFTPVKGAIRYGFKEYNCPKCGRVHKERAWNMTDMLFTLASFRAAKINIAKLNEKKSKGETTK